jgi:NAD-dependent deacetylase
MTDSGDDQAKTSGKPIEPGLAERLAPIADRVSASRSIVVFTGAGISTESGIPDYRGPEGVWKTNRIPTIENVRTDEAGRVERWAWQRQRYPEMVAREPNAGHQAIAALERSGRVRAIVTQNIDGLHQKAGSAPERVLELHGSSHWARCSRCGRRYPMAEIIARVEAGETDPRCEVCGGVLRSSTILFGESLPEDTLRDAVAASSEADLMLVVGSSLVVRPAAQLPVIARRNGAGLVIVNREPTPLDEIAHAVVRGEAGPVLSTLAGLVLGDGASARWNGSEEG